MKILLIHSDYLKFKPKKKAIKSAEEIKKEVKSIEDCLVVFTAVEKRDEENIKGAVKKLAEEIKDVAKQVKVKNIVLYPYAHLSSNLASPKKALEALKLGEKELKKHFKVLRAPFGWYKEFEIKCKGHPLSELSREFGPEDIKKIKKRKKKSEFFRWILIDGEGKIYEVNKKDWKKSKIWNLKGEAYTRLKIFTRNELEGKKGKQQKPKHVEYMQKLELVDYCNVSDLGHMKWYPKGLLMRDLILKFQEDLARKYGAFKILNPLIYRLSIPDIKKLLGEFHERDYRWMEGNEELILRFASDPGAFPYMQKLTFSYKHLPIKEYEEAICFRKEQSGELVGLRRVRNFLMTDVHAFCKDEGQAREEYRKLSVLCKNLMDSIISKGRWVLGWEIVEDFYERNKHWILDIIKQLKVPSLIKLMKERSHYYSLKNEYQSIESDEANSQISTVQFDVVNGKRFNICYTDEQGNKKPCVILHCSTFGSIERTLCSILENAAIDEQAGKPPMLPLWLSPTQVRAIPVSEKHLEYANKIAKQIEKENIRIDIDDRGMTVPKKVSDAEKEWILYSLVIGDKEKKSGKLMVRDRGKGKQVQMTIKELIKLIKDKVKGMPFKPLPLPRELSKRPIFVG